MEIITTLKNTANMIEAAVISVRRLLRQMFRYESRVIIESVGSSQSSVGCPEVAYKIFVGGIYYLVDGAHVLD